MFYLILPQKDKSKGFKVMCEPGTDQPLRMTAQHASEIREVSLLDWKVVSEHEIGKGFALRRQGGVK